jgi:hypothetical protein
MKGHRDLGALLTALHHDSDLKQEVASTTRARRPGRATPTGVDVMSRMYTRIPELDAFRKGNASLVHGAGLANRPQGGDTRPL